MIAGSELVTLQQGDNAVSITQATSDEPANIDLMEVFSVDSDTVFDTTFKYRLDPAAVTSITGEDSTISYCDYTPPPGTCPAPPPPGSGHRRSQMFGDGVLAGDMCGLDTIADRADQVSGACCAGTSTGGSACDAQGALPTSCTYECAATYVPFFDECQHVLVDTIGDQLTAYRNLYSTCIPDDATILMQAVNSAQCAGRSAEWRIQVNSVVGGGPQVQLTEIGLLNGDEQLGAAIIQPTITPQGGWPDGPSHVLSCTNCPNCEQCLNDVRKVAVTPNMSHLTVVSTVRVSMRLRRTHTQAPPTATHCRAYLSTTTIIHLHPRESDWRFTTIRTDFRVLLPSPIVRCLFLFVGRFWKCAYSADTMCALILSLQTIRQLHSGQSLTSSIRSPLRTPRCSSTSNSTVQWLALAPLVPQLPLLPDRFKLRLTPTCAVTATAPTL